MILLLIILSTVFDLTAADLDTTPASAIPKTVSNSEITANFNALIEKADAAIDNDNWEIVQQSLAVFANFKGDANKNRLLEAIRRQAGFWSKKKNIKIIQQLLQLRMNILKIQINFVSIDN